MTRCEPNRDQWIDEKQKELRTVIQLIKLDYEQSIKPYIDQFVELEKMRTYRVIVLDQDISASDAGGGR